MALNGIHSDELKAYVVDGSSAANVTGPNINHKKHRGLVVHARIASTGTPVGTSKIQGSGDGSNWVDITGQSQAVSSSTADYVHELADANLPYYRWVYVRSSGGAVSSVNVQILQKIW